MKLSYAIAKFFSWVLSPMLLPVYGIVLAIWLTPLHFLPAEVRWTVVVTTFFITCVVPSGAVLLLYRLGYISSPGLNDREDRFVPYIVTLLCYVAEVIYLHHCGAPRWMWPFMVGASIAVVMSAVVNFGWKISGHMAGIGGLTGLVFRLLVSGLGVYNLWPWLMGAVLMSGVLGTSRIALRCHTLGQVFAGWANGFIWVFLLT